MQHRSNLTLTIDEDLLRRSRIRALEQGTSVNAVVRAFLESYAGDAARSAMDDLLDFTHGLHASSGRAGRRWTRDQLYDRG